MTSNVKSQAEAFDEIVYAAFSTHFRTVFNAKMAPDADPHAEALKHWNDNLPHVRTLWLGLIKGMLVNVQEAQRQGLIPPLVVVAAAPGLPGLGGGPLPSPREETSPAALARRLQAKIHERVAAQRQASPLPKDTPPGLAVGRSTGDESCDGEHGVVMDAIETHIRGGDDNE